MKSSESKRSRAKPLSNGKHRRERMDFSWYARQYEITKLRQVTMASTPTRIIVPRYASPTVSSSLKTVSSPRIVYIQAAPSLPTFLGATFKPCPTITFVHYKIILKHPIMNVARVASEKFSTPSSSKPRLPQVSMPLS